MQLTQKEKMLLQDQKSHEEMCIKKYENYAQQAQDPELKQLFNSYKSQEQTHLNTIQQMLNGQVPNTSSQQQGQQSQQNQQSMGLSNMAQSSMGQSNMSMQNSSSSQGSLQSQNDADLCQDILMTEKYVSNAYDTAIFEFTNSAMRQALNHIQKEEQQHGEGVFNYMQNKGMYSPQ